MEPGGGGQWQIKFLNMKRTETDFNTKRRDCREFGDLMEDEVVEVADAFNGAPR